MTEHDDERRVAAVDVDAAAGPEAGGAWLTPVLLRTLGGRTGSTLVMQLLATSPEIAFDRVHPFEHRYLSHLVAHAEGLDAAAQPPRPRTMRRRLARRIDDTPRPKTSFRFVPEIVVVDDLVVRSVRHLWAAFSESVAAAAPPGAPVRYYAEKAGLLDLRHIDFPVDALQVVRDPRDMWASVLAFNEKRNRRYDFGRERGQSEREFLRTFVERIRERWESLGHAPAGSRFTRLRYEDLVSDLAGQAAALGAWLGVELDPAQVEQRRTASDVRGHMTSDSPAASVGRWRRDVDPAEQRILNEGLSAVLEALGYDPD